MEEGIHAEFGSFTQTVFQGGLFARPLAALDYLFIFVSSLNNLMNKQSEKQNIKCDCHLVRWCILMAYFTTFIIYLL